MDQRLSFNYRYILGISLVSAMGGLLFGYDWVVIGGAKPFYEQFFDIANSANLQGWAMSCALVGCLAGAILSGMLSDRFGRKISLLLAALLFLASAIGCMLSPSHSFLISSRLLGGIGVGIASMLSPLYNQQKNAE